jgi:peptidoglycan/xylan/chitin deacetylase (PgdA/CDA1 family)
MEPYSADRSLYGKLRRRLTRLVTTKPARLQGLAHPLLTISFDDAPVSAAREGAAILEHHGVCGTYFVSAGLSGQESHLGRYTESADIQRLADAGHEIACHTLTHLDCGRASGKTIAADLDHNRDALVQLGVPAPRTFAYPYGDVSPAAKAVLNDRFAASRALHHGLITTGTDMNQAPAVGIEGADGEQVARTWLERAAATPDSWLVLYTHDVRETPSSWGCTPQVLERLIGAAISDGFEIVTFEQGARRALTPRTTKAA